VKSDGTGLDYAGYFGSSGNDQGRGIAVDGLGHAYVTGWLDNSTDRDAFVVKVDSVGAGFVYTATIGGSGHDYGYGIGVDGSGKAIIAGFTSSSEADGFPVTGGPDLTFNGGNWDGFVARLSASGTSLNYCSYVGGSEKDYCHAVAVDSTGDAYVTGVTRSTQSQGFPVTVGPDLTYNDGALGNSDAFVAKVSIVTPPPSANLAVTGHTVDLVKPRKLISVIAVKNFGPNGVQNAVLNYSYNLAPPQSVVDVSVATSMGWVSVPYTIGPKGVQVELGPLSPFNLGDLVNSRMVRIEANVAAGQVTCKAYVFSQPSVSDPNLSNNSSSVVKSVP
jgi:hypothetical protein